MKTGKALHPENAIGTAPNKLTGGNPIEVSFDVGPNKGARSAVTTLLVSNMDATGVLEISFAGGQSGKFFQIPPRTTVTIPAHAHRVYLQGADSTAEYSILGVQGG